MKVEKARVSSKGQVVIPAKFRRQLGIRRGTLVSFHQDNGRLILQPVTRDFIRSLRGSLKGGPSVLDFLMRERKRERVL